MEVKTINAEWSRVVASRAELLDQLGSTIKSVSASCPVPVAWKDPHLTPEERVRDLEHATVQSLSSQCRLPLMSGESNATDRRKVFVVKRLPDFEEERQQLY
jgi:hypothetical protein